MSLNFLQLSTDCNTVFKTKDTVKILGVFIESEHNFDSHMTAITKSAFYHLKKHCQTYGRLMSKNDLEKLIHGFIPIG